MTFPSHNDIPDAARSAEVTLRMLARVSAPDGLVDRVQNNLRTAPNPSFLTAWRAGFNAWIYSPALRGVAATAIVCVVAGGGWGIYSHVQPASTANAVEAPARVGNSGSFSNADAMRKPDTLNGPVLAHPLLGTSDLELFNVASAEENASRLGSTPILVWGHFWWGKDGSMIFDSGDKATLRLQYSDEFNAKHSPQELSQAGNSHLATVTGRLHVEPGGRLAFIADDIQFADNPR